MSSNKFGNKIIFPILDCFNFNLIYFQKCVGFNIRLNIKLDFLSDLQMEYLFLA